MRSSKAGLNIRIRRLRNVILRAKHSGWRWRQRAKSTAREIEKLDQLQRVLALGFLKQGKAFGVRMLSDG